MTWLLTFAGLLLISGCGESEDMSQKEVEYLSHMDQAEFFKQQGELKASTREARNAIDARPQSLGPYFIIINNLITAGDGSTAEAQLTELRSKVDKEDPQRRADLNRIALLTARARLVSGQPDQALDALERIEEPDQALQLELARMRGDAHREAGRTEAAIKSYQKVLERDPEAIMALVGLSRTAYDNGNRKAAREYSQRAENLDSENAEVRLWRAQMAHREGRYEEAVEAYTLALEDIGRYEVMTRRKYNTISSLIEVLRETGDASQAFVYEEMLANAACGTIRSGMKAAREDYGRGNLQKAASHLEEVLKQAPQHEAASLMLGIIRFQLGAFEDAEKLLAPHVEKAESGELTKMLAAARIQMQRPEEARKMLKDLDPEGDDPGVVALLGFAALSSGDSELGRALIERSLAMAPGNSRLRVRFARYLLGRNKTGAAIDELETAIKQTPGAEEPRALLARVLAEQGKHDRARSVVSDWREAEPESVNALNSAGDIAQIRGDPATAEKRYREAIDLEQNTPESHYALAALITRQDDDGDAMHHFRRAVRGAPDNQRFVGALLASARRQNRIDDTVQFLETVGDERNESIVPYLTLLRIALNNANEERATRFADSLMDRFSDAQRANSAMGSVYRAAARNALRNDNLQHSQTIVRLGRERFRDHEGLALMEARLQFRRDQGDDAREILRDVKTRHPDSPGPYVLEADYLMNAGSHREAAELYKLARDKEASAGLVLKHANALRQDGRTMTAIDALNSGIEQFPETHRLHQGLAQAYMATDQLDKAKEAYEQTLELNPGDPVALNNLAWLLREEDAKRALELAEKAYSANSDNTAIADTYGWILLRNGQVEESIEVLEKAREQAPDSPDIIEHLVEAHSKAGNGQRVRELEEKR